MPRRALTLLVTLLYAGMLVVQEGHVGLPPRNRAMLASADSTSWITHTKDIVQTVAIFAAGLWFLVQWFMRRQLDAAIEFDVEVKVFANQSRAAGTCVVELAAVVKNATIVAAGVSALKWSIYPVVAGAFVAQENQSWLPAGGEMPLLTRDTKWRLSALVDIPLNQLVNLRASCEIDWQPARQTIRYETVFSTEPTDDEADEDDTGYRGKRKGR